MSNGELLLVEDSPADIDLVKEVLDELDSSLTLSVARNGEELIDRLRVNGDDSDESWPDLVLLDLDLPRMNGFDVLREVRDDPDLCCLPVLVLSMSNAVEDVTKCYRLGANGYLVKSLEFSEFKAMFSTLIDYWFQYSAFPDKTVRNQNTTKAEGGPS